MKRHRRDCSITFVVFFGMLPPYVSTDPNSKAALWTGAPSAVYKIDIDGLSRLRDVDRDTPVGEYESAINAILSWMSTYENDHDAWALTPAAYMFATEGCGGDEPAIGETHGVCIGNCMMPIQYSLMGAETSRRCLLTCADGAPFEEVVHTNGDWTSFSNQVFYHKDDKRCSTNVLHEMLMCPGAGKSAEASGGEARGPVVLTCF